MIELRKEDMLNINGGANAILITTIIGTIITFIVGTLKAILIRKNVIYWEVKDERIR